MPKIKFDGVVSDRRTVTQREYEVLSERPRNRLTMEQKNEVTEALNSVDEDIEDENGRSKIDMNANLSDTRFIGVTKIDVLANLRCVPRDFKLATQYFKRNSRSIDGFGSKQKENIATGLGGREINQQISMLERFQNVMGVKNDKR